VPRIAVYDRKTPKKHKENKGKTSKGEDEIRKGERLSAGPNPRKKNGPKPTTTRTT
jgi:hypothetical protein